MLARPPSVVTGSTEAVSVAVAAEQYPGGNAVAAQNARDTLLLSPLSEGDGDTFQPPEAGSRAFPPQVGDSLVAGTHVVGGTPSAMDMLPGVSAVEAAGDVNAALGPDLAFVFDGELCDASIGINDNVENTFVDNNIAAAVVDRSPIEMGERACR